MVSALERYFEFERLGTTWRTEILAGLTTFIAMAYIVVVNPSILKDAGMPLPGVVAATCISAAFGCLMMGIYARYPISLAPVLLKLLKGDGKTISAAAYTLAALLIVRFLYMGSAL